MVSPNWSGDWMMIGHFLFLSIPFLFLFFSNSFFIYSPNSHFRGGCEHLPVWDEVFSRIVFSSIGINSAYLKIDFVNTMCFCIT